MIPLQQAVDANFRLSDIAELREYCKELGISYGPRSKEDALRKALLQHFGKVSEFEAPKVAELKNVRKRSSVIPPYNMILERGAWEGRRQVVIFHKPEGSHEKDVGHIPTVNGGIFPITWGATMKIPEPHYEAMRNAVEGNGRVIKERDGWDLPLERTEVVVNPRFRMERIGVDPATADRAGSLVEYYNQLGEKWFLALKPTEIRELCLYIEMQTKDKQDRDLDAEFLRQRLIEFFFPNASFDEDEPEDAPQNKKAVA